MFFSTRIFTELFPFISGSDFPFFQSVFARLNWSLMMQHFIIDISHFVVWVLLLSVIFILVIFLRVPLGSNVSLEEIANLLPSTLTGADLYALCTDALYQALHRTTSQILTGEILSATLPYFFCLTPFPVSSSILICP